MENIIMLILGVFISVVGIVNIKGNISTIHSCLLYTSPSPRDA